MVATTSASLYSTGSVKIRQGVELNRTQITEADAETTDNDQAIGSLNLHEFPLP